MTELKWRQGLVALFVSGWLCATSSACPNPAEIDVEIYPTSTQIPENALRFYVYFSQPIGHQFEQSEIELLDEKGAPLKQPFLPVRYNLWSQDRTRLTMLLDPGRVKSGLSAHETLGRPLEQGHLYTLQLSEQTFDTDPCLRINSARFAFRAGPPDIEPPRPSKWTISAPIIGSRSPLKVDLGSPHDHVSMVYRIRVTDSDGDYVPGEVRLSDAEQVWEFVPRDKWRNAIYAIKVDPRLEDLAGNRPGVVFDRMVGSAKEEWRRELTFAPTKISKD